MKGALTEGPVGRTLIDKAIPMVLGIAAIIFFNIVDTFWVGQLGAEPLAAMSFTFPVTFVVLSLTMGMGVGATSVISNAIGHGNSNRVRRLTTDSLFLANVFVVTLAIIGLLTQAPLFALLGAEPHIIALITEYMTPWYLGVGFLVIPIVGNSAIRATGDMKTPALIMAVVGLVNAVLDPFLIFGIGPFPRLELQGAAITTVISWICSFAAAFWVLGRRERLLDFSLPRFDELWASWRELLYVSLPAAATNILTPLAAAVLTRIVAEQGTEAVAAWGVANRIESLALVGIMALGTAMTPFAGQNLGAGHCDRLGEAISFSIRASFAWGACVAALLALSAPWLAAIFSDNPLVNNHVIYFLWIVPISYTLLGIGTLVSAFYNGSKRPMRAAQISVFRLFIFSIPLGLIGARLGGMTGLFIGVAVGNILTGVVSIVLVRRFIEATRRRIDGSPDAEPLAAAT
ncbi:MAG: MATE family efflux transporter [Myxococcota bacterium]